MEEAAQEKSKRIVRTFNPTSKFNTLIIIVVLSLILGTTSGFFLSNKESKTAGSNITDNLAKTPQQDSRLCRDFADGTIKVKPAPKDPNEYTEGTHLLERDSGQPVALTSSVIDLSEYENKKVKIFGETQKALKEGWLMDVCRVETK